MTGKPVVNIGRVTPENSCPSGGYGAFDSKFLDNAIHGRGSFYFAAQKARYTGQFRHNKKHGLGVYTWATGNR